MSKLALFVEGQTEALFAKKLLLEIAGAANVVIDRVQASGPRGSRKLVQLSGTATTTGAPFYALIRDCASDSSVVSDLLDEYEGLRTAGFTMIVGLRDVYPVLRAEMGRLRAQIQQTVNARVLGRAPDVRVVLAVMEVEAWFMAEHTHFERLSAMLTPAAVVGHLGFDPSVDDVELRVHPAADLRSVYNVAGLGYVKSRAQVQATLNALDHATLYIDVRQRVPSLDEFFCILDDFLA